MNSNKKIPHRLYLTEDQMPKQWFNLRSAMPEQPDHTDVGAHFMGLAAGLPLGALIGWHISRHGPPRAKTSVFWGALALGIVGACWALALRGYAW